MSHNGKLTNSTGWNAIFYWIKCALTGKRDNTQAVQDTEVSAESLVDLNARVEALESALTSLRVEADKVDYKIVQKTVANPSVPSSGTTTATSFISAITQNENGEIAPERRNLPAASASVPGITKVYTSTGNSTDGTMTRKAISEAIAAKQPERLVVTPTESGGVYSNDFATISAAVTAGKDVWLRISSPYDNSSYFHYVPLSEAVFKNGAYTKFIFARPRSYETDAEGIIDTWTCTETSPYWTYSDNNVYYATTSGTAATAGTANSASNANLGKTTDTTNGDVLYIGGGTQQRIENAGHANSAKDYDQTGSIATALNSKQNLLYFTNTDGGTTSNPAADKKYVDSSIASWMLAVGTSYVKYRCNGEGIGSGNIGSIFWLSQIIYLAQDTVRIDIRGDFSSITKDNKFAIFPAYAYCGLNGSAEIRYKCKQYVRYLITLTNVGDSRATIWAISGGRATQSQAGYLRRGTLQIDGVIYETDTVSQPQNWDVGYFNWGAIGSIPAKSSRTWEMFWFGTEDTPGTAFSGRDYTYITTIK